MIRQLDVEQGGEAIMRMSGTAALPETGSSGSRMAQVLLSGWQDRRHHRGFGKPLGLMSLHTGSRDAVQRALIALFDATAAQRVNESDAGLRTMPPSATHDQTTPAAELARDSLRVAVMAFAHEERAAGTPAEQVLVELHRMATDAHYGSTGSVDRRALRADVVRWAISGYYQS